MDRGRVIDNIQNTNARYIDQYGVSNKTSVRTSNPPGSKSSFSLGWSEPQTVPKKNVLSQQKYSGNYGSTTQQIQQVPQVNNYNYNVQNDYYEDNSYYNNNYSDNNYSNQKVTYDPVKMQVPKGYNITQNTQKSNAKTSVKVKYAPGGQSNFSFGYDNVNYDDFRKK